MWNKAQDKVNDDPIVNEYRKTHVSCNHCAYSGDKNWCFAFRKNIPWIKRQWKERFGCELYLPLGYFRTEKEKYSIACDKIRKMKTDFQNAPRGEFDEAEKGYYGGFTDGCKAVWDILSEVFEDD